MNKLTQRGFTIIELMIATVVFSIVLLTISAAIVQIGRLYFKGLTASQTQSVARNVMDSITQAIELTPGDIIGTDDIAATPAVRNSNVLNNTSANSRAICLATSHYSYKLGQQVGGNNHGLISNQVLGGCTSTIAQNLSGSPLSGSMEMLGEHMRLAKFQVKPANADATMYSVAIRVVYGDADLLCDSTNTASGDVFNCATPKGPTEAAIQSLPVSQMDHLSCKNVRSGTQFCAVSELSTMVERRMK